MSNKVDYVYCGSCGYEDFDCNVAYSRRTADGSWWFCPACNAEISQVEVDEEGDK